jgi:hypothetical protein
VPVGLSEGVVEADDVAESSVVEMSTIGLRMVAPTWSGRAVALMVAILVCVMCKGVVFAVDVATSDFLRSERKSCGKLLGSECGRQEVKLGNSLRDGVVKESEMR